MLVRQLRHLPSARRTLQETLLNQERLIDLLQRARILSECRGDRCQPHRSAVKLIDEQVQDLVIDQVQSVTVDVERLERIAGDLAIYAA